VRTALNRNHPPTVQCATLCGLLAVLQLESVLIIAAPAATVRAELLDLTGVQVGSVMEIVRGVERTCAALAQSAL
jgi:hypothetical protein